ncbi:hypothetical protein AJ80_05085 [Polytolypa hystricis UAMH7299]|uniref:Uncharacterized protein n=1 Tax=Polytolypa hystricis (strain UAMH7299) TaxID=1447883 RepID=A0A2B7Y6C5_POLH7|nr:hypothetical protein AJ80_05085 [Polytolypa hystricis UAMH7299]
MVCDARFILQKLEEQSLHGPLRAMDADRDAVELPQCNTLDGTVQQAVSEARFGAPTPSKSSSSEVLHGLWNAQFPGSDGEVDGRTHWNFEGA